MQHFVRIYAKVNIYEFMSMGKKYKGNKFDKYLQILSFVFFFISKRINTI